MQCSETVSEIASALAQAQLELSNPEKAALGHITEPNGRDVSFRYASDKQHLKFVASQPCVVCGRAPSDAHHLRFAQPRGLGLKSSDEYTVPLCRTHHRENHRTGVEREWWQNKRLDPLRLANKLWSQTRGLPTRETHDAEDGHLRLSNVSQEEKDTYTELFRNPKTPAAQPGDDDDTELVADREVQPR